MGFNGIDGDVNVPGMIPWEVIVAYFVVAIAVAVVIGKKTGGLKAFTTLDLVYIGIGAAFSVVWEFYIGGFLNKFVPSGLTLFINFGFLGRLLIVFIVAALVRKFGTGMITLAAFDILGDLFHYGFGGEPIFLIYEALTYGLFIDIAIALLGGKFLGVGSKTQTVALVLGIVEGAIIGLLWAIPDPIFYDAFFRPFLYGAVVSWAKVIFTIEAFIPGDVIMGAIAGIIANRIQRAVAV
ncbi:hypothetical protein HS7_10500 [Sulfolobales archaeon HS-7]|nr:hypothetical protein HS7_10500 [Sulfolobales archaeon HS-7]